MYKTDKNLEDYSYKNIPDISNKKVLIRASLDVAIDKEANMVETIRYNEALPCILELVQNAKSVVLSAHLGRPTERTAAFSFEKNVFAYLIKDLEKIGFKVKLCPELSDVPQDREEKTLYFLDNIRFFAGEESKDMNVRMNFAKELAELADVFVNDAFPAYREAASTYDIAKLLPSYLGPVFFKEVNSLSKFSNPEKPFVAVLGGAKLSEKLDALRSLAEVADKVIIGGAMAYTLMKAQGIEIGKSLFEEDKLEISKEIMEKFADKILLPKDHLIADKFDKEAAYEYTEGEEIPTDKIAIDIGWKSINEFKDVLRNAKSILWNGPMGVFEWEHSSIGTKEIGSTVPSIPGAFSLAGGGDSIAAINKFNLKGFSHISTGGGAMLAFLAYEKFPILDVIVNK